jgi:tetratricopeptide (TPR) repeat protein
LNATQAFEERVVFGRDISPEVNICLQEAVACADDFERARDLLYRARDMQPDQLEVYIALYKFCFYRGHLDEAEQVALDALQQAAKRGGFTPDWQQLNTTSTDWTQHEGAARVFLYSLKALAFIRLRKGMQDEARQLLAKLQQLDTQDLVGSSVIMDLAQAL